jgi:hypothetical protein
MRAKRSKKKKSKKSHKPLRQLFGGQSEKKVGRVPTKKQKGTSGTGPRLCGENDES